MKLYIFLLNLLVSSLNLSSEEATALPGEGVAGDDSIGGTTPLLSLLDLLQSSVDHLTELRQREV